MDEGLAPSGAVELKAINERRNYAGLALALVLSVAVALMVTLALALASAGHWILERAPRGEAAWEEVE